MPNPGPAVKILNANIENIISLVSSSNGPLEEMKIETYGNDEAPNYEAFEPKTAMTVQIFEYKDIDTDDSFTVNVLPEDVSGVGVAIDSDGELRVYKPKPIFAHIARYSLQEGFEDLLTENAKTQVVELSKIALSALEGLLLKK
jgi:hypothetical protein